MKDVKENIIDELRIEFTSTNIEELTRIDLGATVVKIGGPIGMLLEKFRADAERIEYEQAETKNGVIQNFKSSNDVDRGIWLEFAEHIAKSIQKSFQKIGKESLLHSPVSFDNFALQWYSQSREKDQHGIGPHRDQSGFINLVVVLLIIGPSSFFICADKQGNKSVEVHAEPGDLIVMRGGSFGGSAESLPRPHHFVGRIEDPDGRITFGMRQLTNDPERRKELKEFFGKP